jgi:acetyl esterase
MPRLREQLEKATVRTLPKLPDPVIRVLGGRPTRIDGQELHPQVQLAVRFESLIGGSEIMPVAEKRAQRRRDARVFSGPRIEVERTEEIEIPTADGPLGARLYVPYGIADPAPLIVYFHGGGHVIGDLDTHDQPCRFFAREVQALVLAIDYRLGPEHPFPAAVDDALAGFRWACAEASRLGADPERIAVAGDSAGGNLAAVVCQLARDEGGPRPRFQALIYPVIDYSDKRRSYELFGEGFFLTSEEMDWYRDNYFAAAEDRGDPRASPILAADLSNLPPAHVVTSGFDPLRDEGEDYARALEQAGVPVTLRRESDLVHGFINAVGLGGRAGDAAREIAAALRAGLARGA